ncbi:unnamed protein product, partial [Prorocentrum cordatum]
GNDCWDGFSLQGGGAARRSAEDAIEAPSPPPPGAVAPPPPPPPVGAAPPPPPRRRPAIPKGYACQPGRRYTGQAWGVLLTGPNLCPPWKTARPRATVWTTAPSSFTTWMWASAF